MLVVLYCRIMSTTLSCMKAIIQRYTDIPSLWSRRKIKNLYWHLKQNVSNSTGSFWTYCKHINSSEQKKSQINVSTFFYTIVFWKQCMFQFGESQLIYSTKFLSCSVFFLVFCRVPVLFSHSHSAQFFL